MASDGWGMDDILEEFERRFRKMQHLMEQTIREALGENGTPQFSESGNMNSSSGAPAGDGDHPVDIIENRDTISITAELPKVRKEDIDIEVNGTRLIVTVNSDGWRYRKEIELPEEVETESARATYKNGVLDVEFKKKHPKTKGKKITIA